MILLDTHVWVWWLAEPSRLSTKAAAAIAAAPRIAISAISCWEVTMLAERGRLAFDRPIERWIREALTVDSRIEATPLHPDVAVDAGLLAQEGFHGDPADRFLYATAMSLGAPMVTRDAAIRAFSPDRTVW